jgi:diadenosine tetraphosphate (Ap4A) HIT family hydrolase
LVIPKKHYSTLLDISPNELVHLTSKIQPLATSILKALDVTDFNLLQNNGPSAAQVVQHLHFHIIPRPPGSLSWLSEQSIERIKLPDKQVDELHDEIKKNLF